MIVSDKEAVARLTNPINLINSIALRKNNSSNNNSSRSRAMSLFGLDRNSLDRNDMPKNVKPVSAEIKFNPFENIKTAEEIKIIQEAKIIELVSPPLLSSPSTNNLASLETILVDSDQHIKLSLAHDSALEVLNTSVAMLALKLDEVKADKLPSVITAASKVVESIRRERMELNKSSKGKDVHYHFYTPEQRKISDYEVIEVSR